MLHLPVLRGGRPYRSLEVRRLTDVRTGEPVAEISQANPALIAKDLAGATAVGARRSLRSVGVRELLAICRRAAHLFATADLPVGCDGELQSPGTYVRQLSASCGLPESLCRFNLEKVRGVLDGMETVLAGLTRGLDLTVLDTGLGTEDGRSLSYVGQADALGAILPSNSPGVHTLWLPALALGVPVALKPGREEPWTPYRVCQAFLAAGLPGEALGFYPSDHAGAAEILQRCGRSLLFGDAATVRPWQGDPRVEIHGPGWSKVVFGEDEAPLKAEIARFRPHLLVHNDTAPISDGALDAVPFRAEVLYSDGLDARVSADGSSKRLEDASTEDLLELVDRAVAESGEKPLLG